MHVCPSQYPPTALVVDQVRERAGYSLSRLRTVLRGHAEFGELASIPVQSAFVRAARGARLSDAFDLSMDQRPDVAPRFADPVELRLLGTRNDLQRALREVSQSFQRHGPVRRHPAKAGIQSRWRACRTGLNCRAAWHEHRLDQGPQQSEERIAGRSPDDDRALLDRRANRTDQVQFGDCTRCPDV